MNEVLMEKSIPQQGKDEEPEKLSKSEKRRMIVHLSRVFSGRFDMKVLPSGQKGLWATGLDKNVDREVGKYLDGERETLDDLPAESFEPKRILYDDKSIDDMGMDEITAILHHEAGHAKFSDFRTMVEGQKRAKDEGHLPTSFWLIWEGIEDPRIEELEGQESPAIERLIRKSTQKSLNERLTESPLRDRPFSLQFVYNSLYYWLNRENIPELEGTEVAEHFDRAKPLIEQYFQNTDSLQRKELQQQIWEIAQGLEKKDLEDEEKRQMQGQNGQSQKGSGSGQGQPQLGNQESDQNQTSSGSGDSESEGGNPPIPGGRGERQSVPSQTKNPNAKGQGQDDNEQERKEENGGFLDRLKKALRGENHKNNSNEPDQNEQNRDPSNQDKPPEQKQPRPDLSKLTPQELEDLQKQIDDLSPEEKQKLQKKARVSLDEQQREALEKELQKTLKLAKNKEGEFEVDFQMANKQEQERAQTNFDEIEKEVVSEEEVERQQEEAERLLREAEERRQEEQRQQKLEMEKAGFSENELEEFLTYQELERSIRAQVRNFTKAMEKVVPRKSEQFLEGSYFTGPKFDKRDLVRKAPLENQQFWQRSQEASTGEPRLFVGLLVDNSGSMAGVKMQQARKTMIFFSEAAREMGIPLMVSTFADEAKTIKEFKQDFNDPAQRIKPKLIESTDASGSSTNLHQGLDLIIQEMNHQRRKAPDSHGLIFVITDGQANAGLTGPALKDYIEDNRGKLTFKSFGLSQSEGERQNIQNYLNGYFGQSSSCYPQTFDDLPGEAFRLLRVNLIQFQRYLN